MDWQHLIMNGENLAEYAALLAAEGLLGHQHANSGWGTFDDDNMVGATAFMETLELAIELRRAGYGDNGERLGFDLYPYTEDAVGAVQAVGAAVALHRRRRRRRSTATRCAKRSGEGRRRGVRARVRRTRRVTHALIGLDVGTTGVKAVADLAGRARSSRPPRRSTSSRRRSPGWAEQDPEDWWRAAQACLGAAPSRRDRAGRARCTASSCSARTTRVLRPAILWNDQRTAAECAEIEARVGLERLIELTGNRALTGFTAPKLLWLRTHEPEVVRADPPRAAAEGLRALSPDRRARDRRGRCIRDAALRRRAPALVGGGLRRARDPARVAAAGRTSRPRSPARATRPAARSASGSSGRGRSPSCSAPRASSSPRCPRYARRPGGPRARLLPRGAGHVARDGRDALGGGLARAGCATWSAADYGELDAEAERWAAGTEGLLFRRTCRASARRTPTRTRAARSPGSRSATTAARSRARRSRASHTGCATRSSCCASSASSRVGRVSGGGAPQRALAADRRLGARPAARAHGVEEGAAFGAALLARRARGRLRRRARGGRALRRVRDGSSPTRVERRRTRGLRALPALYPALKDWRSQ